MDILVNVANQKLKIAANLKSLVKGTQEFIRFVYNLTGDWDGLTVFAQFIQNGVAYNQLLDSENSAYLPAEIGAGTVTMMLYGSGGNTIATTNYLTLTVDENIFVQDAQSTEITQSLYQQLVNTVRTYTTSTDRLQAQIDLKATITALAAETTRATNKETELTNAIAEKADQTDVEDLQTRMTSLENNSVIAAAIQAAVEQEMLNYLNNGELANLTIEDGSITRSKVDANFEATLVKADTAMQASVYDPLGYGDREVPVDPYSFAQAQDTNVKNQIKTTETFAVTDNLVSNVTSNYTGMENALSGVLNRAERYASALLGDYSPFTILIVDTLPDAGAERTFYLVPKESGNGYEKFWYITDENNVPRWDKFGASSTIIVDTLPSVGDSDVDYILSTNGEYQYYKYIGTTWALIAGSNSVVIEFDSTLDYKGEGTPAETHTPTVLSNEGKYYLDIMNMQVYHAEVTVEGTGIEWVLSETLVENPTETKDYFLRDTGTTFFHLRYVSPRFYMVGSDAYSRDEIDEKVTALNNSISETTNKADANTQNITSLSRAIDRVSQDLSNLDVEGVTYYATLSTEDNSTYIYTLYEVEDGVESVKSQFTLPSGGGGGGSSSTTTLVVDRITESPVICTPTDRVVLEIDYSSTDSDGELVDGSYSIRQGSSTVMSGSLVQGRNSFDITDYCTVGTQKFTLTVTDEGGSVNVKSWTVQIADVRIESAFNDRYTFNVGSSVNFTYTPYGSVPKTIHFKLDGVELDPVNTTSSGTLQSYTLSPQTHGAHLLECWITATINNRNIETDHIYKDIIWYDENSTVPVIGCIYRYDHYGNVNAKQYNTTSIPYVVYSPLTSTPTVTLKVDGEVYNSLRLSSVTNTWAYKSDDIAVHILQITCGSTTVEIHMNITELGYNIEPVTANLEFDFNPTGYSNSSVNRLWHDENSDVALTVSSNFDWSNGGYQIDENGNQYFCVKAGTRAYISYNLFENDPKQSGAEFKVIFKTANVRDNTTTFLSCVSDTESAQVGLRMDAHYAYIFSSTDELFMPYSEEDIIEFEYNINTLDLEDDGATSYIMTYEDGVGARPMIYNNSQRLYQYAPVPITIGSDDCDVYIYRMKAYSSSLTDSNILSNFIADSLDSDTMIARYERNQIYDENGNLTPDSVANACPNLKVIKIECPHFTNDKKDYVKNTNVECIHKNGDPILDNWKFTNGYHAGQGTTSNEYGYAGRNIDIIFGFDGQHQVVSKIPLDTSYITELTLGDGTKYSDGSGKVALTRTSVPNNWFNIKVNIASSENSNNALLQKRYNDYLPYQTPAMRRNPFIKNSMEFYNCVIFIKENDPDVATHREFNDLNWHFYGIGNLGDSKKTDNTRVNDPTDLKEFVVEISDNTLPNSWFQTGVYKDANDNITYDPEQGVEMVYPITSAQWNNANNLKRISLYDEWDESFEFRYDMGTKDGETISSAEIEAQQEASKQVWRDMYEFVITSSDSDFVSHLSDWFIQESPIYWYLFTERYTMIDNRAKNSFWHWGKTYITEAEAAEMGDDAQYYTIDNTAAAINNGYRFDLWNYDDDTSLGINNTGELTMTYGHEDIDYKVDGNPASGFIFNAADNVFFRRIRKLMYSQLQAMYLSRESLNCWSANSLITEFDNWQNQFPEELWRLDIERKYLRTYRGGTERFLKSMMNGRKRYQRRQFERDQEAYIGTKYVGTAVRADQIMFRCNTPQTGVVVSPDYTLRIVPYSDMYLTVLYGNSPSPKQIRAKAGQEYEITTTLTEMDDTAILIYCASRIQALNDLSACYIHDNDFSKASKLKTLIIGNTTEGYQNTFLTTLNMGNNTLLETLDIRNCPNLTGSINLSACSNLENLYAEGTSISSATFARNGKVKLAHFPSTVNTLSFLNLNYLTDLIIAGYSNLETFICEYSVVDALSILQNAINTLQTIRILGVDWQLADTSLLNTCVAMHSSLLSGYAYISGQIRNQELLNYSSKWADLTVEYNPNNIITQFLVTYVNDDDNNTELYSCYVDQGSTPPDPVTQGLIDTPTIPSTDQYDFTFNGWDDIEASIISNKTIKATYVSTVRSYTVRWFARAGLLLKTLNGVEYGESVDYLDGVTYTNNPTWTDGESSNIYHLFTGWDKSTGFIRGDVDVYATWETSSAFPAVGTDMKDMSVAEIYGIGQANMQSTFFEDCDYVDITLGHDFNFSNVEDDEIGTDVLLSNVARDQYVSGGYYFDGSHAYTTDIKLFDESSPAFTMAIDFQFNSTETGATLVSSHEGNTAEGFRLYYNGSQPTLQWGDQTITVGYGKNRDIVVIRHPANSRYLYVYTPVVTTSGGNNTSSRFGEEVLRNVLLRTNSTQTSEPLTFGAVHYPTGFRNYGVGTIHWCKIWYDDLGETNAMALASFPREVVRMEYWGAGKYYYANTSNTCKLSFIANNQLGNVKGRGYWHQPTNTNVGGWDASELREFMNGRIFDAYPTVWQSAIKAVEIRATAGNRSTNILTNYDKIYAASYRELGAPTTEAGYIEEVGTSASPISWFINNPQRIKFRGKIRKYDGDSSVTIYTCNQEPAALYQTNITEGTIWINTGNNSYGYIFLSQSELDQYGITPDIEADSNYASGGWVIAYYWWERSPGLGGTTYFMLVNGTGYLNYNGASYVYGVVPCFSI